jgi:CHAT domain-containing protein
MLRRALLAGPAIVLLCASSPSSTSGAHAAPSTAESNAITSSSSSKFEILDLNKAQGVALRLAGKGKVLWIDLQTNEFLRLSFEQENLDIEIAVFSPLGELLFEVDSPRGAWGPELVPLLGESPGRYRLEITGDNGPGSFRLSLGPKRKASDRDRQCLLAAKAYYRGKTLAKLGKAPEAGRELEQSMRLWRAGGYPPGAADAAYKLGLIQKELGHSRQALDAFSQALPIYRSLKLPAMQALILNEVGQRQADFGQRTEASKSYDESLAIAEKLGLKNVEVNVLINRCKLRELGDDLSAALQDAEIALPLAKSIRGIKEQVKLENLKGRIYVLLGEPEEALRHHQQARRLLQSQPDPELSAYTLVHFGDAYRNLHDWNRAIGNYTRAIRLWRRLGNLREESTALNNLSIVYSQTGLWQEARNTFRRVREIDQHLGDRAGAAVASVNLAWLLGPLGRYGEALNLYRESLAVFQEQGRPSDEAVAYFGLAWIENKRGNLNEARRLLEKSLAIVESIRAKAESRAPRAQFLAQWQDIYDLMVEVLMKQHAREPVRGFDLLAFAASERARCRTLLDSVEGRIVLPSLSWADLQKAIDPDTILLEYFLGEEKSFLWVVTSGSLNSYTLPAKARIEALAHDLHQRLARGHGGTNERVAIRKAEELSRILLGQIAGRLNCKRLLIVAPPELQYVSFGALPKLPVATGWTGKWPTPWLDKLEVVMEPSATFLLSLRRLRADRQPAPDLLAVVAAPVFPVSEKAQKEPGGKTGAFSPLRYSREEAMAIAGEAMGRAVCFLGPAANPNLVLQGRLRSFRILHFSAHGLLVSDNPQESAIVLSSIDPSGKETGGKLRAREIAKLDLPSDLVVLSACSTGLGTEIRGEGLVGLTQAFFSAGASSITASLWEIDDLGTSELMKHFYRNLLQKRLAPSAALREAQLTLWKQARWRSPHYWAGFVLQGEWR